MSIIPPKIPIPPRIPRIPVPPEGEVNKIKYLFDKVKKCFKCIKNLWDKSSEEAGKIKSLNDDNSIENVDNLINVFTDFKEKVHNEISNIENIIDEEVEYYLEELNMILEDNLNIANKYRINMDRIKRRERNIISKIHGCIDNEISKRISLNNPNCLKIVRMIPGSKKENEMKLFLEETIKNSLDLGCLEIRNSLDEIYEDVEIEIISKVEDLQNQNILLKEKLENIDKNNYESTAKQQILDSYFLIDVCDVITDIL